VKLETWQSDEMGGGSANTKAPKVKKKGLY
jgi:hypothetical protein